MTRRTGRTGTHKNMRSASKHLPPSAPAELHVRAARREKGARRALGRFEPVGSLASLWGVRNRYSELTSTPISVQNLSNIQVLHID